MASIFLPADMVSTGYGMPAVCPRHGRAGGATRPTKLSIYSRPPIWVYLLILLSLLIAVIVLIALRKTVKTSSWPACDTCRQVRRRNLTGMRACLLGWIPLTALGLAVDSSGMLGIALLFALPLVGFVLGTLGSWGSIVKAKVTADGGSVELPTPHPDFVAALPPVPPTSGWPSAPAPSIGTGGAPPRAANVVIPPWEQN